MIKIKKSKALGRIIRMDDDISELGVSTWVKLKEAIKGNRLEEALEIVDYLPVEGRRLHELLCDGWWAFMTHIADAEGEEQLYTFLRTMGERHYKGLQKLTPMEFVQLRAESMRAHCSGPDGMGNLKITEEKDRFVITFDPCGSGGRMRRCGRMEAPYNFGKTKKAYPWSWDKVGVPYYCLHCAIWSELLPIEWYGYPQRVTLFNEDPNAPCAWAIYKDPTLIPEQYFARVGKKKDISKMQIPK
jgi:hypothetical protein